MESKKIPKSVGNIMAAIEITREKHPDWDIDGQIDNFMILMDNGKEERAWCKFSRDFYDERTYSSGFDYQEFLDSFGEMNPSEIYDTIIDIQNIDKIYSHDINLQLDEWQKDQIIECQDNIRNKEKEINDLQSKIENESVTETEIDDIKRKIIDIQREIYDLKINIYNTVHAYENIKPNPIKNVNINSDAISELTKGGIFQGEHVVGEHAGMEYATFQGLNHETNEDALLVDSKGENQEIKIMAVADGVSGNESGELASKRLLSKIDEWFRNTDFTNIQEEELPTILKETISIINNDLYEELSSEYRTTRIPATTLSLALIINNKAFTINIGDSRIYICDKEGKVYLMSEDNNMGDEYRIKDKEERTNTYDDSEANNVLYAAIPRSAMHNIPIRIIELNDDDKIYLATDGITDTIYVDENGETKPISRKFEGKLSTEEIAKISTEGIYNNSNCSVVKGDDCTIVGYEYKRGDSYGER